MGTDLAREIVHLVLVEPDRVRDLIRRALAEPHRAGAQAEGGQGLDQRDLGRLQQVEGAAHRGHDRREAIHLTFACAVLLVHIVEKAARDGGGQALGDVLEPALGERDDLVVVRLALDRPRKELDRRPPVDGEHVDEGLERQPLRSPQPTVVAGPPLEVTPWHFDVAAQRGQEHVDEAGRGRDEILAGLLTHRDELRRSRPNHLERLPAAFHRVDAEAAGQRAKHVDRVAAAGLCPGIHLP